MSDQKQLEIPKKIPFFGARKIAQEMLVQLEKLHQELAHAKHELRRLGAFTLLEIEPEFFNYLFSLKFRKKCKKTFI